MRRPPPPVLSAPMCGGAIPWQEPGRVVGDESLEKLVRGKPKGSQVALGAGFRSPSGGLHKAKGDRERSPVDRSRELHGDRLAPDSPARRSGPSLRRHPYLWNESQSVSAMHAAGIAVVCDECLHSSPETGRPEAPRQPPAEAEDQQPRSGATWSQPSQPLPLAGRCSWTHHGHPAER